MRLRLPLLVLWVAFAFQLPAAPKPSFELRDGDRVAFVGDTLLEREQFSGYIELALASHYPDAKVSFRNLGWSADTPRGDSRSSLSKTQAGHEPADEAWNLFQEQFALVKPTVVFLGYGMANSFDGANGLPKFTRDLNNLIDTIQQQAGATKVRFVLLSPIRHENLGAPLPDPSAHNAQLALYNAAIQELAAKRGLPFVSLFNDLDIQTKSKARRPLTDNGIHLNERGYQRAANVIERSLGLKETKFGSKYLEQVRAMIIAKNQLFFDRSRPQNMAYLLGFRKAEQGKNAVEIPKFDGLVSTEDAKISVVLKTRKAQADVGPSSTAIKTDYTLTPQPLPEFEMAPGFEATLWAENPLLAKPIQMNFDARGRLWVASSAIYPQIEPGQKADDKILILEDTTGSGKANKSTVFVDGLLVPTAVLPGDGGVYVGQSTELLHFKDTNGDGKADQRRIVLSSFGTEDSHHNIHTLRWAPDGQMYFDQSIYIRTDAETPHGVVRLKSGGIFNLRPQTLDLEVFLRGFCNPWGHAFDEFGQSFVTDGAGNQGINFGIRDATYFTYANMRRELKSISPGSYPKFCGLETVHSEQFPSDWQGNMITSDFRAHRVVRFAVTEQGAGFAAQELTELMRTTNVTFRPIDAKFGPDGALYVADWSNPIINHGEVDFRDPRRDHEHGRIWRITAKNRPLVQKQDLTKAKNKELLDLLLSPNEFNRVQAHRVLTERGQKISADLNSWTKKQIANGNEKGWLEALWSYQAIGEKNDSLLQKTLTATDGRIRAAAVRVLADKHASDSTVRMDLLEQLAHDSHPRVRLEAVRALAKIPSARSAALVLQTLESPMDPFLDYAVWLSINDLSEPWLASIRDGSWKVEGHEKQLEFAVRALEPRASGEVLTKVLTGRKVPADGKGPWIEFFGTSGDAKLLGQLFEQLMANGFNDSATEKVLKALTDAARTRNVRPEGDLKRVERYLKNPQAKIRVAAVRLAGAWKLKALSEPLLEIASGNESNADLQKAAFESLRETGGSEIEESLQKLTTEEKSAKVRQQAATALAQLNLDNSLTNIVSVLLSAPNETAAGEMWRSLLNVKNAGGKLAGALPKTGLPLPVAKAGLKVAREGGKNESDLILAITRAANLDEKDKALTPDEMKQLAEVVTSKGDPARGEKLFRNQMLACVTCHAIGGAGGKVGPDLTSIGASAPVDYLIESLLFPNSKIKEGYHTIILTTKDEQEYSGIVQRETDTEVVIRDSSGKEVSVAKNNLQSRKNGGSLMPSGLMDNLTSGERADLIRFLSELGKPGPYDASKGNVARAWKLVALDANEAPDGVVKGDSGPHKFESIYTNVSGDLLRDILLERSKSLTAQKPGTIYASTKLQIGSDADIAFQLDTAKGSEIFIDGTPLAHTGNPQRHLAQGKHTVVIKLSPEELPEKVRLQVSDGTFVIE
jgi:putative heme-binding domain-containing protein